MSHQLDTRISVVVVVVAVRGSRPGKTVQMTESEVRGLCLKSREIFLQQPILLELEAPLKICGRSPLPSPAGWPRRFRPRDRVKQVIT